eukprot:TRINITY_DN8284_c0_g1_i5.p1 TRINITY_DN8284_c0_g1~~TRINITY_DN8284_c0_g1_i5.p1  ORF type:complete len:150 (-),score=29.68 TRINITY_DN8284_c0_g1_i5:209-658(-)
MLSLWMSGIQSSSSYVFFFFFQAEDGIRDHAQSRGLGDVYKRQVLSDVKVTDVNCGFKLFTSKSAKSIFNILHLQRWSFDVESFMIAYKLQTPIQEVPVNWQEIEGSKLNVVTDSIAMTRDIILVKLLYLFKIWRVSDKIFSFSDKKEN